jgi:hypothetical protein
VCPPPAFRVNDDADAAAVDDPLSSKLVPADSHTRIFISALCLRYRLY